MIHDIVLYNSPILRKTAELIPFGTNIQNLILDMYETMYNASGCGLAATQIGKPLKLFVAEILDEYHKLRKIVAINPVITIQKNTNAVIAEEGCLSIPNITAKVSRIEAIKMNYYNENWQLISEKFYGFNARVILHEFDHLIGKLYIDYLPNEELLKIKQTIIAISNESCEVPYKTTILK